MNRKTTIVLSGIGGLLILFAGVTIKNSLASSKKPAEIKSEKIISMVYTDTVKNQKIPISIITTGSILARDRMVLFSEVQGVFMPSSKQYKPGARYSKGETMIQINNEEFKASVVAQRSSYRNLITSVLADIQFDYPNSLATWKNYLNAIDINKTLPDLPIIESEKERNFITSKNINPTFYSIKNLETRLQKHAIRAPFSGVLVDASVTPGTLISPGQKLGEFIRPTIYELELNVNANLQEFLKIGKTVELQDIEKTKTWKGKVTRINQKIDRNSQTIKLFVEVTAKDLKEGEYLEASVFAKEETSAIEIPRALLVKNHSIYIVKDSVLHLRKVEIVYSNLNSVVIKGLENGLEYISKPVVGSYEGMRVQISK